MSGELCIVLARVEQEQIIDKHGRIDLGERHTFRAVPRPVAVVWANHGGERDVKRAESFALAEGYRVLSYPASEPDPLGRARADVMRAP